MKGISYYLTISYQQVDKFFYKSNFCFQSLSWTTMSYASLICFLLLFLAICCGKFIYRDANTVIK